MLLPPVPHSTPAAPSRPRSLELECSPCPSSLCHAVDIRRRDRIGNADAAVRIDLVMTYHPPTPFRATSPGWPPIRRDARRPLRATGGCDSFGVLAPALRGAVESGQWLASTSRRDSTWKANRSKLLQHSECVGAGQHSQSLGHPASTVLLATPGVGGVSQLSG